MSKTLVSDCVSEACQINDLDHSAFHSPATYSVSEACQINDLDHELVEVAGIRRVSEACQINDLDHTAHLKAL